MLAKLIQAVTVTTLAVLVKRLLIRRKPKLPYRRPESTWPRRSYREPSWEPTSLTPSGSQLNKAHCN